MKSRLKKGERSRSSSRTDHFIIQHAQRNKHNDQNLIADALDPRRVVFVSLIGLYQSWRDCPSVVLYSAMFILPLNRQWIYHPRKFEEKLESYLCTPNQTSLGTTYIYSLLSPLDVLLYTRCTPPFLESTEMKQFIECLKWKDSQDLVFWMKDFSGSPLQSTGGRVHPFWNAVNSKLSSLYDPITGHRYRGLYLEEQWWNRLVVSKYDTKIALILEEICCLTMRFNTIQEILYQSNPKSLNPVIAFSVDSNDCSTLDSPCGLPSFEMCHIESYQPDDEGIWFIADDYDQSAYQSQDDGDGDGDGEETKVDV